MSSQQPPAADTEKCSVCDAETPHDVSIELVTESERERNSEFSREPYRVTECEICGEQHKARMNDA
jgi:hypothetical protein